MSLIALRGVTTLFGPRPRAALRRVAAGEDKAAIRAATGHVLALRDVSLDIAARQVFVIMGLSGSGKSTLIRHLNRLIDPTAGAISVGGADFLALSIGELTRFRRAHMAMVFQHFGLLPHRTVLDNAAYALELRGQARRARRAEAAEWLAAVGLAGYESAYPDRLSGGQKQRVGLARALAAGTDILLMDEPFSALDPLIRAEMQELLTGLQARLRKTVVVVTHDLDEALRLGDRIAVLKDGAVVQVGAPAELVLNPADDYVRAFVRDVNRARVLDVAAVMEPPGLRLADETVAEAVAALEAREADQAHVFAGGRYVGVVSAFRLRQALRGSEPELRLEELAEPVPALAPKDALARAVRAVLASPFPVPVLDGGELVGAVPREAVARVLAG